MNLTELYLMGMKHEIVPLPTDDTWTLELGPGNSPMGATVSLDFPEWNADVEGIPFSDEMFTAVYAFHFLEHLAADRVVAILREVQRVLKVGGVFTLLVPYYKSEMAYWDLDHKTHYTEGTWKNLFEDSYYDKNKKDWKLTCKFNFIMGEAGRSLALFSQLVKLP